MDLERSPPPSPAEAAGAAACSICLDPVLARVAGRSVAKLQCGHEFHLGQIPRGYGLSSYRSACDGCFGRSGNVRHGRNLP